MLRLTRWSGIAGFLGLLSVVALGVAARTQDQRLEIERLRQENAEFREELSNQREVNANLGVQVAGILKLIANGYGATTLTFDASARPSLVAMSSLALPEALEARDAGPLGETGSSGDAVTDPHAARVPAEREPDAPITMK